MQNPPDYRHDTVLPLPLEVTANAWAVDAACSGNPGPMEYQAIDLATGAQVFHFGPVHGTNNIGEFLAIVHALALLDKQGITGKTIYSDSHNAILWVQKRQCKTKLLRTPQTEQLYQIIARAEAWLRTHQIKNPILKTLAASRVYFFSVAPARHAVGVQSAFCLNTRYKWVRDENPHSVDIISLLYSGYFIIISLAALNRISLSHILNVELRHWSKYCERSSLDMPIASDNISIFTEQSL